jgi:hypothetical protein
MDHLFNNEPFLALMCTASRQQGSQLLRTASKDQIDTLCEIARNILDRRIPLSQNQVENLRKIRKTIYMLVNARVPWSKKKIHLARQHQQSGGFPPLLALLAPIVGGALGALTEKFVRSKVNN